MNNAETTNTGHGHVRPRPDGVKARCGGPAMCRVCKDEAAALAQPQPSAPSVEPAPTRADEFDRMLSTLRYVLNAGRAKDGETARDHYCAIINSIAGRAERTEAADVRFACEAVKRAALHFGAAPLMANGLTTSETAATASVAGISKLDPNEDDPGRLWSEIARLCAALKGPDGYATWQDAATAERVLRVKAERAAPQAAPVSAPYVDSTPHLNVGNSAFESWFQAQPFATQPDIKQISRDSYAAGMGDPLVMARASAPAVVAPTAPPAPAAVPAAQEPIQVEAVAEVREDDDGLYLGWLIEGGIAAMEKGCILVMPHSPITDDDGSGEVYSAAPLPAREPRQPTTEEQQERAAALLDGFDSRIETAEMNGDMYDAGYLKAMRAKFRELLDAAGITLAAAPAAKGEAQ